MPIDEDIKASLTRAAHAAGPSPSAWDEMLARGSGPGERPNRGRTTALVVGGLIGLAAVLLAVVALRSPDRDTITPSASTFEQSVLDALPPRSYDATTIEGERLDRKDFEGRPVIVVAWAPWCEPCADTLRQIQWATERLRLSPSAVGVSFSEDADAARAMAADMQLPFPTVAFDRTGEEPACCFPTVWVLRGDGTVAASRSSSVDRGWLADAVYEATFGAPSEASGDSAHITFGTSDDGATTATWTFGDTVRSGVPIEVVVPDPSTPSGSDSPSPGTVAEFLGIGGFTLDQAALSSVEPPLMTLPEDVLVDSDPQDTALLAFRAGEGPGTGYLEWGDMTILRTPTDLRLLESGRYRIVVVGRGSGTTLFQFAFDVDVTTSTNEDDETVDVPDLVGMTDQQAMLALDRLGLHWVGTFRSIDGVDAWQVASTEPVAGATVGLGSDIKLVIATEVTPLPKGAGGPLACDPDQQVAFGGPRSVILPGGSAFIRGNTSGVELTDKVTQVTFEDQEWHGIWHVIRDGSVIAVVDFATLDGVACAGSGVAGA